MENTLVILDGACHTNIQGEIMEHESKKYLSYIVVFVLFIITCTTLCNRTFEYAQDTTRAKWIAKCKEARNEEKAYRISKGNSDFQKALAKSIIKMQSKLDEILANRISVEIINSCKNRKLDPIIITALICVESRFNVLAHGSKGEVGLMQIRYGTWKEDPILQGNGVSAKSKLYHIDINIKCGTDIFAKYYKESEYNVIKTLYRYNSGSKELPENKKFYEISYANKVILTAYNIRESIRKDKEVKVLDYKK